MCWCRRSAMSRHRNRAKCWSRSRPPPGAPDIPGLELAGEVVALGDGVQRWKAGDKVTALVAGGAYAEYAVVHETNALPVIPQLSMIEAGAIPETFFTVWHNVFERGALKSGETMLC